MLRDPKRRLPFFCQELFSNIARALNVQQGTGGAVFIQGSYRRPVLKTPAALYKAIGYVMANPVAAGCVREPRLWPGLITLPDQLGRRTLTAARPRDFFRDPGEEEGALTGDETARDRHRLGYTEPPGEDEEEDPMRDSETLTLTLPPMLPDGSPSHGRAEEVRRAAADWLARELDVVHAERREAGATGWVGVHLVKRQDPLKPVRERGQDGRPTGARNPRFATQSRRVGREEAEATFAWLVLHRAARVAWSGGDRTAVFPVGTWLAPLLWGATAVPEPEAHPA